MVVPWWSQQEEEEQQQQGGGGARERIRRSSIRELHHLLGAQMELLAGKRVGYRLERCQPGWAQAQPLNREMQ